MARNKTTDSEITPIFILGAAHSGTTILYNMLALHPDLTWFSLFSQRGRIKSCGFRNPLTDSRFRVPFLNYYDKSLRKLLPHKWEKILGLHTKFYFPRPIEGDHVWDYLIPRDGSIQSEESIHRIRSIFKRELKFWNKKSILIKAPRLFSHISILNKAFPQSKFIHIVRDGRAVSMSVRFKFMRYGESNEEGLHAAAKYWVRAVNSVREHKNTIDVLEFRYEDFCLNVHEYLKKCLNHTGLDANKFPFKRIPEKLKSSNYKWLEMVKSNEKEIIWDIQNKLLDEYGYIEE